MSQGFPWQCEVKVSGTEQQGKLAAHARQAGLGVQRMLMAATNMPSKNESPEGSPILLRNVSPTRGAKSQLEVNGAFCQSHWVVDAEVVA